VVMPLTELLDIATLPSSILLELLLQLRSVRPQEVGDCPFGVRMLASGLKRVNGGEVLPTCCFKVRYGQLR